MLQFVDLLRTLKGKVHPQTTSKLLIKSINMYIWVIGALNLLLLKSSCAQIKFPKNKC